MPAPRAIHLTAGLHHPAAATAPFWASLFDDLGISVATFEDIDAGCAALAARPHDLLVVSALRWSMTNDEKYAVHRDQWGYDIPSDARAAITAHLARGGALLAMHAATLCFDTWPQWEEIVGGRWVWGQSGHPPYGPVSTRVVAPDHPLMQGVSAFESRDEVYGELRRASHCEVLAQSRAEDGKWMPTVWCHQWQGARIFYDALGHNMDGFTDPAHRHLLTNAIGWLLGPRPSALTEDTHHAKY